jgi:hypothetical protein
MEVEEVSVIINPVCDICTENFNKVTRKRIECPRCHKTACGTCLERYLLESVMDAHCMFCREIWDPIFLRREFSSRFMDVTYKKHREDMLWERQRALLPDTMPLIEKAAEMETLHHQCLEIERQIKKLQEQQREVYYQIQRKDRVYRRQFRRVVEGERPVFEDNNDNNDDNNDNNDDNDTEKVHYRRGCAAEHCPGLIQSRTGYCGSCHTTTCIRCNVHIGVPLQGTIQEEQHTCTPENVEQWKFIQESSRPCPGCRIRISKESGCDQMWCPNCRTAFSWSSGKIEQGTVHNPHYYEWLFNDRRGGGGGDGGNPMENNLDGNVCVVPGRMAAQVPRILRRRLGNKHPENSEDYNVEFLKAHRHTMHNFHVELPRLRRNIGSITRRDEMYTQLRIDYLQKKINRDDYKIRLQRIEKANRKTLEYNRICETYINISVECFDRYGTDENVTKKQTLNDLSAIRSIAENAIKDLNAVYKSKIRLTLL